MMLRGGKYKGGESAPRPSAFARFKKPKLPGAHTGKTFGKREWLKGQVEAL
ncbi:hypothetical protein PF005_g33437 [Phytophthora fragariae]|uniref:Uncharacterized protein n=2 Tax=Phytophthora fragariae TaxID=53985 RepID=A0A6A3URT9_9STRA|nr:hypothetical protein PF005_g33437 [Phytophthora fragariae]KAE9157246.1 hypothetical protein PF002_g33415 [Phytophthora fragariae]